VVGSLHEAGGMARIAFAVVLSAHALLHALGVVKGLGLAPLEALRTPITRAMAGAWGLAGVVLMAGVVALLAWPRWFWLVGAVGLVSSQLVLATAWQDARFGTLGNALLAVAVVYGGAAWGPFGLRAAYEGLVREAGAGGPQVSSAGVVTETDVAALPAPVQRYLRFAGVVGRPRPAGFRARMTGRIRSGATAPWMPFEAEQVNFFSPPRRFFWMKASRGGVPVDGLHAYTEADASMRVRVLSVLPVVDVGGADFMRTETVTLLNDMAVFSPAALLDPKVRWRALDSTRVEATFTNGPHEIRSVLVFAASGALVDFWSDDRPALDEDGKTLVPRRWSTPLREYRPMGALRLASRGEARYAAPTGDAAYLELEVHEVASEPLVPFSTHEATDRRDADTGPDPVEVVVTGPRRAEPGSSARPRR
jgi:hypothetical protein